MGSETISEGNVTAPVAFYRNLQSVALDRMSGAELLITRVTGIEKDSFSLSYRYEFCWTVMYLAPEALRDEARYDVYVRISECEIHRQRNHPIFISGGPQKVLDQENPQRGYHGDNGAHGNQ